MIKIRLWGTRDELAEALPVLRDAYDIRSESEICADRGQSKLYRLYIEADIKPLPGPTVPSKRRRSPNRKRD